MAENDDKLKDLKSRLGLVSAGGKKPAADATAPAKAPEKASEPVAEQTAAADSESGTPAPMAAPTREMSAEETVSYTHLTLPTTPYV